MSDYSSALKKARDMRGVLLDFGVPEVSIELRKGRPSSFGQWDAGFFVAEMSHHTVSRYSAKNLTPVLNLVKNGRSDLAGPLSNGYGGWDLCYRIICFGYANHPGAGGPVVIPALNAGSFTIPKDSARRYTWGTEFEGGLNEKDWDRVLKNPRNGKKMTFREFMGRSNAGLEVALEIHRSAHLEHSSWTSRKIDRLNYTRLEGIVEKDKYRKQEPAKALPVVDFEKVRHQFRIAAGLEKGRVTSIAGVKKVQRALNKRYDAGLQVDGKVGDDTLKAWKKHEKRIGVVDRPAVPDMATLSNLGRGRFSVRR
jgi:hypothetical protein